MDEVGDQHVQRHGTVRRVLWFVVQALSVGSVSGLIPSQPFRTATAARGQKTWPSVGVLGLVLCMPCIVSRSWDTSEWVWVRTRSMAHGQDSDAPGGGQTTHPEQKSVSLTRCLANTVAN